MLDQSFSAHNFDIIYGMESRKGKINIKSMPEDYLLIVSEIQDVKLIIRDLKKENDEDSLSHLQKQKERLLILNDQKKALLYEYLEEIAKNVNNSSFRFTMRKFMLKEKNKETFLIDTSQNEQFFAIKQLQYNLKNVFKVKQANRHQILTNIKLFLNSKIPVYIIRTDISGFYENIPQTSLLSSVIDNPLLSHKSKSFISGILREYEKIKDTHKTRDSYGVPRGIGISSYLSEIYMRDLDEILSKRREVMYYARYVDDIFIILSSLPIGKTLQSYYNEIVDLFKKFELDLKQPHSDNKCELIDLFNFKDVPLISFDYLGYKLEIERRNRTITCKFRMKDKKVDKIKEKINNAIKHFNLLSVKDVKQAYRDLIDSLDYITGNISLSKTKAGVKTGLYYSNDLLDEDLPDLDQLTEYLHECDITPYSKLQGHEILTARIKRKLNNIDFVQRWKNRKYNNFSLDKIERMDSWL